MAAAKKQKPSDQIAALRKQVRASERRARILALQLGWSEASKKTWCERSVALRAEVDLLATAASTVSREEANELQDILRTLTPSGTALITSARELVAEFEKLRSSPRPQLYVCPNCPHLTEVDPVAKMQQCGGCATILRDMRPGGIDDPGIEIPVRVDGQTLVSVGALLDRPTSQREREMLNAVYGHKPRDHRRLMREVNP